MSLTADITKDLDRFKTGQELLEALLSERVAKKAPLDPDLPTDTDLPDSWCWACPDQLAFIGTGATPKRGNSDYYENGTIPWVTSSVVNSSFATEAREFITPKALDETNTKLYPKHTLLIALYGEGKTRGKITELLIESATNQAVAALVFDGAAAACRRFVKLFFEKHYEDIRKSSSGGVQPNLNLTIVKQTAIPFPPLPEQRRIVARIEELFSRLDAGVAALRHAKAQLQRYRQSVLAAAVTGQLTQAWREQHPDSEPAEELLEHGLTNARDNWAGKRKFPEPSEPNTEGLPALPRDWRWAAVEQTGDVKLGRQRSPKHMTGDHIRPYLRVANVYEDRIDTADVNEMNFTPDEFKIYELKYGDILLNEGQSLEWVGRPAMYRDEIEGCCFQNTLVRYRGYESVLPSYALTVFRSYLHRGRFQKIAKWTNNIAHLGAGRFKEVEFPLPPLAEQHQIVAEVEARTTAIDHLEAELDRQLTRSNRLRQSTLAAAFEARL